MICGYHSRCLTVVHRSHGCVSLIPTFLKMTGITEDFLELTVTVDPPNQKKHKTYMRLKLCLWSSGSPKSLQHERKRSQVKNIRSWFSALLPPWSLTLPWKVTIPIGKDHLPTIRGGKKIPLTKPLPPNVLIQTSKDAHPRYIALELP